MPDPVYTYSFCVWPDETWNMDPAVYALFRWIAPSLMQEMTEAEFNRFRSGLSHHGLTLREIGRAPYVDPEIVL